MTSIFQTTLTRKVLVIRGLIYLVCWRAKLFDVYVHADKIDGSFCITEIDSVNLQNMRELNAGN